MAVANSLSFLPLTTIIHHSQPLKSPTVSFTIKASSSSISVSNDFFKPRFGSSRGGANVLERPSFDQSQFEPLTQVQEGIFPKFSREEFENFITLADKLRSDYDFAHTTNVDLLPRGESPVTTLTVRLLKPFDELVVDLQKFEVDALEKFIQDSSIPLVTLFDQSPTNQPFLVKYFESPDAKAMLFLDFGHEHIDAFKSKYTDAAGVFKGKGLNFLRGDVKNSQAALQYFGVKEDQSPVLIVQNTNGLKFINSNVEADQLAPWLKDYLDGKVKAFIKSEPIPETNDEPVKVVVADSLKDMVLDSKKNRHTEGNLGHEWV